MRRESKELPQSIWNATGFAALRRTLLREPLEALHWSRYELHNRTSIHSKKLIITISPPRSNNTANSLAKSINLIMKALITRRPGYELSYESHNEANSGLIARDQSEISR